MKLYPCPFRLGLRTYSYGVIFRWRGLYHAVGRRF